MQRRIAIATLASSLALLAGAAPASAQELCKTTTCEPGVQLPAVQAARGLDIAVERHGQGSGDRLGAGVGDRFVPGRAVAAPVAAAFIPGGSVVSA